MEPRELDRCVTGCAQAHQRLLADLDERLDRGAVDVESPTGLPHWTVGHVLGHLIGNAEAFTGLLEAAAQGEVGEMYPGGVDQRRGDIDRWSSQSPEALVTRVRHAIWALERTWAACTADTWRGEGRALGGTFPLAEVPLRRWREVEVHHADLAWGYGPADWDGEYVRRDLDVFERRWLAASTTADGSLPAGARVLSPADRLAWLLGRLTVPDLPQGLTL